MQEATRRPPKTLADLQALPDDVRAELIRGEIYVPPSPSDAHQRVALELATRLHAWLRPSAHGKLRIAPLDAHLPTGDVVQPDLLFVRAERVAILREDGVHGVPDLVVEIVSPANPDRDRVVKREIYEENGLPEYWIVDPAERGIEVFRLEGASVVAAGWFREGETLVSATLPGLRIDVGEVFAD